MITFAVAGCGGDAERERSTAPSPEPAQSKSSDEEEKAPKVEPAVCPPDLEGCVSATGTILYVERVDPDGDGDAHFVLADSEGITAPGITVVDVPVGLRPEPLPGPGEELSAAGLVQTGSFDQRQIESVDVSVAEP